MQAQLNICMRTYHSYQFEQVLSMLACWVEDPNGDYFKKHLARIPDYLWVAEDGMKMQVIGTESIKK